MIEIRAPDEATTTFSDPIAPLRVAIRAHYEILRQIGQGAFATVYLARDLKHERKVAIKVLNADPTSETGELRFIREIRTVARLQHPNILPLYDSGHVEALLYYVMPYVEGETVRDRIDREKQLPLDAACIIAREAADALAYAHGQGIIHRDIKPENILLSAGHPIIADFGIARAIDLAGVRQLTRTGMGSPGTPAYMSPEQLLGDREIDGRSDIYSLGCVLYEMLAGKPPFPGKEGFVKRFTEAPPTVRATRRDLPEWVDAVLAKTLARNPNERYPTAQEFVKALRETDHPSPPQMYPANKPAALVAAAAEAIDRQSIAIDRTQVFPERVRSKRRTLALVGTSLIVIVAAVALAFRPSAFRRALTGGVALDTARFAILPFVPATGGMNAIGWQPADSLYDAFSQWDGLPLVSDTKVAQAITKNGGAPSSESQALSLARGLGAGKLVWGQVTGKPGAVRVRVHLYNVSSGDSKDEFVFIDSTGDGKVFTSAATRLLRVAGRPRAADGGDRLTRSYPAWSAYGRGHVALAKWDLSNAEREFRDAVRNDPSYLPARLWLGQVIAWRSPEVRQEWADAATHAWNDVNRLEARDRVIAVGLSALATGREPDACKAYSELTRRDSVDFVGWYGLGECQSLDSTVVPSTTSSSRWRFRSSYHAAVIAYVRALEIEPGAHAIFDFRRLHALLLTSSTKVRVGKSELPNSQTFMAYPSLSGSGDTLGFIPYPLTGFARLPLQAMRTRNRALEQNADQLRQFATNWTRRAPSDPAGFEALAEVLEINGDITGEPFSETAVMQALRRARALSHNSEQLTRTAGMEVWLRFKREEFAEARLLADSLLAANSRPTANDARVLIPIAALTGKLDLTVRLGRFSQPFLLRDASMPTQVREAAVELFVNAALGICGDRIALLEKRLQDQLVRYVPADQAADLRADLLRRPLSMTVPCNGGQSALRISNPRDRLSQMQQAFARGQLPLVRALLDTVAQIERLGRPGDMSIDYTFQQAWLRAAIGDTTGATRILDNTLGALPALSADNLGELAAAAAVGRAMALRARLAASSGDSKTAQHWARALATLWATADQPLKPFLDDVRSMAGVPANR